MKLIARFLVSPKVLSERALWMLRQPKQILMAELIVVGRIELVEGAGMCEIRRVRRARRVLVLGSHIERPAGDGPAAADVANQAPALRSAGPTLPL